MTEPERRRPLDRFLATYFRTAGSPSLDEVRPVLWKADAPSAGPESADYRSAVLEQYTTYVEMADRISARRGQTNAFFLTLNTAIITFIGVLWENPPHASGSLLLVPWVALVVQCLAWFWLLRSYRQLNSAKYAVIGALEERLPASPYWSAEWAALGRGEDPARYWPLSHIERLVPAFFAALYSAGFAILLFA